MWRQALKRTTTNERGANYFKRLINDFYSYSSNFIDVAVKLMQY